MGLTRGAPAARQWARSAAHWRYLWGRAGGEGGGAKGEKRRDTEDDAPGGVRFVFLGRPCAAQTSPRAPSGSCMLKGCAAPEAMRRAAPRKLLERLGVYYSQGWAHAYAGRQACPPAGHQLFCRCFPKLVRSIPAMMTSMAMTCVQRSWSTPIQTAVSAATTGVRYW